MPTMRESTNERSNDEPVTQHKLYPKPHLKAMASNLIGKKETRKCQYPMPSYLPFWKAMRQPLATQHHIHVSLLAGNSVAFAGRSAKLHALNWSC